MKKKEKDFLLKSIEILFTSNFYINKIEFDCQMHKLTCAFLENYNYNIRKDIYSLIDEKSNLMPDESIPVVIKMLKPEMDWRSNDLDEFNTMGDREKATVLITMYLEDLLETLGGEAEEEYIYKKNKMKEQRSKGFLDEIEGAGSTHADSAKTSKISYEYFYDFYDESSFGGDTINTVRTVLGALIRVLPVYNSKGFRMPSSIEDRISLLENSNVIENRTIIQNANKLKKMYHSIANFMPHILASNGQTNSMNAKRSLLDNDFFDEFLKSLNTYFSERETGNFKNSPKHFYNDLNNKEFLDSFESFEDFVRKLYLEDYIKENGDIVKIRPNTVLRVRADTKGWNTKESIDEIEECLESMVRLIELRAKRLSDIYDKKET